MRLRSVEPRDSVRAALENQRAPEVRHQLERILADPSFSGASRRSRLLRYLIEQVLEERFDALKECVIAAEVFERPADYDPQVDSVVRVEVGRLRARLAEYYNTVGVGEPVRIYIPRGGYRPAFEFRDDVALRARIETPATDSTTTVSTSPTQSRSAWKVAVMVPFLVAAIFAAWVFWRARSSSEPAPLPTIVVLPFLNFTGNAGDDYLGDGLSEELTEALAEFSDMRVVSRTSAFQYKGRNADVRDIGQNLRAGAVLEGSIAWRGPHELHVVAQLIRTSDGYHLWSHGYDASPAELAPIEASIVGAVREKLSPSPKPLTAAAPSREVNKPRNPEAHDLYMRAVYEFNQRTEATVRQSIVLAQQAASADPSFAQPWVLIAAAEQQLNTLLAQAPHAAAERAWEGVSKALALDPGNSAAHAQRALLAYTDHWDWPQAEREFRLALEEGSHGSAESLYGWCLISRGRFKEARAHLQTAAELDPLSLGPQLNQVGELMAERNFAEARQKAEQLLLIAPQNPAALSFAANLAFWQKDCKGATALSNRFLNLYPHAISARIAAMGAQNICGHLPEAEAAMAKLSSERAVGYVSPYALAAAWAVDGKADAAIHELERSADNREPVLMLLRVDQSFDSLRQDQRFLNLERKLGLLD
jgi:adenylate cyclase